jgi:hypothetical protein
VICALLRYYAAQNGNPLLAFWDNVFAPSSRAHTVFKMASSSDFLNSSSHEELTFLPNKDEVNVILNGDKAQKQEEFPVNNELLDLCKDMLEFKNLLRSATRSSVKEVIKHEIDVISAKVASLNDDSSRNNEDNNCWREVRRKNRGSAIMKQNAYGTRCICDTDDS